MTRLMQSNLSQQILINGNKIHYQDYQNEFAKETIVCLHGFLSSSFSFRRLIPLLHEQFHVISIDLPPFGKSGKSKRYIYSYKNLALTVIELLEKLGIKNFTLLGHSMGGQLALNIVHLRPDLVDRLILLSSSAYLKRVKLPLIFASYLPFSHLFVKRYLERSGLERNLRLVVHDQTMIDQEMENGYLEPFLQKEIFHALTRMIRDWEGDLPVEILNQIETPCLLIWGEQDKIVPLQIGKQLNKDLNKAKLIVLKDTGHLIPEERPKDVLNYIRQFINEPTRIKEK